MAIGRRAARLVRECASILMVRSTQAVGTTGSHMALALKYCRMEPNTLEIGLMARRMVKASKSFQITQSMMVCGKMENSYRVAAVIQMGRFMRVNGLMVSLMESVLRVGQMAGNMMVNGTWENQLDKAAKYIRMDAPKMVIGRMEGSSKEVSFFIINPFVDSNNAGLRSDPTGNKTLGLGPKTMNSNTMGMTKGRDASPMGGTGNDGMLGKFYVDDDGYVQFPDGSKYKGPLKNGNPEGVGVIVYPDGSRYEGDWKAGNSHGFGILLFPDGSKYEGSWNKGKYHGKGIY